MLDQESKDKMYEMLDKMKDLIKLDNLTELEPYCIALHGRVCHCREQQRLTGVKQ